MQHETLSRWKKKHTPKKRKRRHASVSNHFYMKQSSIYMQWEVWQLDLFLFMHTHAHQTQQTHLIIIQQGWNQQFLFWNLKNVQRGKTNVQKIVQKDSIHSFCWNVSVENIQCQLLQRQREAVSISSRVRKWAHPLGGFSVPLPQEWSTQTESRTVHYTGSSEHMKHIIIIIIIIMLLLQPHHH